MRNKTPNYPWISTIHENTIHKFSLSMGTRFWSRTSRYIELHAIWRRCCSHLPLRRQTPHMHRAPSLRTTCKIISVFNLSTPDHFSFLTRDHYTMLHLDQNTLKTTPSILDRSSKPAIYNGNHPIRIHHCIPNTEKHRVRLLNCLNPLSSHWSTLWSISSPIHVFNWCFVFWLSTRSEHQVSLSFHMKKPSTEE